MTESEIRDKSLDHTTTLANDRPATSHDAYDAENGVDIECKTVPTKEPTKKGKNARWNAIIAAVQTSFERHAGKMMSDLGEQHYFMMNMCIRDAMNSQSVMKIKEAYYKEKEIKG